MPGCANWIAHWLSTTYYICRAGHSVTGKGPTGKGPRREFRALTSAGQRHESERAERELQGGYTGGGAQLCIGFEREWRERRHGYC